MILFLCACGEPLTQKRVNGIQTVDVPVSPFYDVDTFSDGPSWQITRQLVSNGKLIYLGSPGEPVYVFDDRGRFLNTLGRVGEGPGEYGLRRLGLYAEGDDVWVVDRRAIQHYREGRYYREIRLPYHPDGAVMRSNTANHFAVDQGLLLFPSKNLDGRIASLIDAEGRVVAEAIDPNFDEHLLTFTRKAKNAHWQTADGIWYCLYSNTPRVALFDARLQFIRDYALTGSVIEAYTTRFFDEAATSNRRGVALFFGFRIFRGKGFAMTQKGLHQFDLDNGEVEVIYQLKSQDIPGSEGYVLSFPFFAILDNGSIVVSQAGDGGKLYSGQLPLR
ncbi:MAG: 6-bladed beta-propeller [Acidobacteriota bacterium]|nr:6-bladed beta-propeller [Acidobacteriota bacterium]